MICCSHYAITCLVTCAVSMYVYLSISPSTGRFFKHFPSCIKYVALALNLKFYHRLQLQDFPT